MYTFGQYGVRVELLPGDPDIVLRSWKKFARSDDPRTEDAFLTLEECAIEKDAAAGDGWKAFPVGNEQQAVYTYGKKTLFALRYTSPSSGVSVRVRNVNDPSVGLGLQFGMLLALYRNCVGLHGVTLLCGNEIVILSAPSGTGKTTLAKLLEEYCDAVVINGDFAMLSVCEEGVIFEPTPYCGSSGRCLNRRVRIDHIVFLEQAKENRWTKLSGRQAMIRFLDNAFVPTWDARLSEPVQNNIAKMLSLVKADQFSFAPDRRAAEDFRQWIL